MPLDRAFYDRPTVSVAIDLVGALLWTSSVEGIAAGRIVETEAYGDATDLASHAARLKRGGVLAMHGIPGIAYVYRSYGIHAMFNVVAKPNGATGAVLIRAVEPVVGLDLMRRRRPTSSSDERLASGPGNLCQAMGIVLADHGADLTLAHGVWISAGAEPASITAGPRIGITRDVERPWRFFDSSNRAVSAHRRGEILPSR